MTRPPLVPALALAALAVACFDATDPRGYASVVTRPAWVALVPGDSVALAVTVVDRLGDTVPQPALTWSTTDPEVARVTSQGVVHAVAPGGATIIAQSGAGGGGGGGGAGGFSAVIVAPPVFLGAGDIAECGRAGDEATAEILDTIPGVVFTAGDNAYPNGSAFDYAACYDPSWGRHRDRTRPTPGNHEYFTPGAAAYFDYFTFLAGDDRSGYYSFDFAGWHFVALNSNVPMAAGSAQERWLRDDLAAHPAPCTLAYWHHPRFSSGAQHGNHPSTEPVWQALYDAGADVVVGGHDHTYERFAPQTPTGTADAASGIRQFVVGTGGAPRHTFSPTPQPNSERRDNSTGGVITFTLRPGGYDWRFVPAAPGTFTDQGSGTCH